jgi:hypothetical protein
VTIASAATAKAVARNFFTLRSLRGDCRNVMV